MKHRGFTLIELMVSVAIFTIVMVIALGALLSISAADRKAETIATVMNNLNFALESMTRNIRTGYDYHCLDSAGVAIVCNFGADTFKFTSALGLDTRYKFDNTALGCGQSGTTLGCILRSTDGGVTWASITAPEVIITNAGSGGGHLFYLRGEGLSTTDNAQPYVTITVAGLVAVGQGSNTTFKIQTSATQRLYDR